MSAERELAGYVQEAASWDADRVTRTQRSARNAWRVAAAACVCVIGLLAVVLMLLPLRRIEPYLIRVNTRTGAVDAVPPYRGGVNFRHAIARYFLARYVTVCERFDYALARADYQQCGAFNSDRLNQALYLRWARGNPHSPLNLHRDGSTVAVHVEAVSFLGSAASGRHLAQVRFVRITRHPDGTPQSLGHWIATVRYAFTGTPDDSRIRRWNPLGFRVTALELDRESLDADSGLVTGKGRRP